MPNPQCEKTFATAFLQGLQQMEGRVPNRGQLLAGFQDVSTHSSSFWTIRHTRTRGARLIFFQKTSLVPKDEFRLFLAMH